MTFASTLCTHLDVEFCETIGGMQDGAVPEFLDEKFGGVIGYVAEFCFAMKAQKDVTPYLQDLDNRIDALIDDIAEKKHIDVPTVCRNWLDKMSSPKND